MGAEDSRVHYSLRGGETRKQFSVFSCQWSVKPPGKVMTEVLRHHSLLTRKCTGMNLAGLTEN
jgi:hypothetical protein